MIIEITHQEDKRAHSFIVKDESNLTNLEIERICKSMGVKAIFIKGKYYENPI